MGLISPNLDDRRFDDLMAQALETIKRACPSCFITTRKAVIPPGKTSVTAAAFHCEYVDAELAGYGTGDPGLTLKLRQSPVVVSSSGELELIIGVETPPEELRGRAPAIRIQNKTYRIMTAANHGPLQPKPALKS